MSNRNQRRHFALFVNNELQLRIVSYTLIYMAMVFMITLVVGLYPVFADMFMSTNEMVQYHAAQAFLVLFRRMLPALAVTFTLFLIHMLLVTHRICGPLVNFVRTFERVSQGDLSRKVHLRQGDYLKRECARINAMIDGVANILGRVQGDYRQLTAELEKMRTEAGDMKTCEQVESMLDYLRQQADTIGADLEAFKLATRPVLPQDPETPA